MSKIFVDQNICFQVANNKALSLVRQDKEREATDDQNICFQVANNKALSLVRQDKEREATDGHDGTWVAHPGLVPIAREIFDERMPSPNQIQKQLEGVMATNMDLTAIPEGTRTESGFRHNISVTLDAATAEISRAQLWQWLKHDARLEDGRTVDAQLVKQTIAAETERRLIRAGSVVSRGFGWDLRDLLMELKLPNIVETTDSATQSEAQG
ncbi:unnamed protein product [Strongylus vulgaris]|uniref:malate synthase n=1 Tax=Strongylus vulgaris TaxID=40348 RepID=A0A3P7JSD6_STRVU|nr:unnamed protein product [Strongylus vulgaris]